MSFGHNVNVPFFIELVHGLSINKKGYQQKIAYYLWLLGILSYEVGYNIECLFIQCQFAFLHRTRWSTIYICLSLFTQDSLFSWLLDILSYVVGCI